MDDNDGILPNAQPFSPRARPASEATPSSAHETQQGEESAAAPARRVRTFKPLTADTQVELRNTDLRVWERDYITNMAKAAVIKNANRATKIAKQNADFWIWQMGIAGIGGMNVAPGLEMFYGDRFILAALGLGNQGRKRDPADAEVEDDDEERGRRTRQRTISPRNEDEEVGRGVMDDDSLAPIMVDVSLTQSLQLITILQLHTAKLENRTQTSKWAVTRQHHSQQTQPSILPPPCRGISPPPTAHPSSNAIPSIVSLAPVRHPTVPPH